MFNVQKKNLNFLLNVIKQAHEKNGKKRKPRTMIDDVSGKTYMNKKNLNQHPYMLQHDLFNLKRVVWYNNRKIIS